MPRPQLNPSEEQRQQVKVLAAYGMRQPEIARFVEIRSPKTLRKHFRKELDRGELEGYVKVQKTRFQMATDGKHPQVTEAWLASYARRHGQHADTAASAGPPAFIIIPEEKAA